MSAAAKEVRNFIEQYFTDEPNASINDCVRDALGLDIAVTPSMVSDIRREFRLRLSKQPKLSLVPTQPVAQKPAFTPHWITKWPTEEAQVDVPEPPQTAEEKKKYATVSERRKFYDDVLLENPDITVTMAMRRVKEKFGKSVDPKYAVDSLRLTRELHAGAAKTAMQTPVEAPKPKTLTLKDTLPADFFKPAAKEPPVAKEELDEYAVIYKSKNGSTSTVTSTKTGMHKLLVQLSSEGVETGNIRVYKQVKLKIKVEVDFGE